MEDKVILKRNYRGLNAGIEFTYDEKLDSWKFEVEEEEIGDTFTSSFRQKIQFSDEFVKNNPAIFTYPVDEKDAREEKLDKLYAELEKIQEEINKLIYS